MSEQQPTSRVMTIPEINNALASLVDQVNRKEMRVLVEERGIPVAALVAADDLARWEQLDREWAEGTCALERFSEAFADVPVAELEARIAEIIAEGRAKDAKERRTP